MKNYKDIDNFFKSIVEPAEMTTSEKVWVNITKELDKEDAKNKKRGIFFFSLLGFILLLFGVISVILLRPVNTVTHKKTTLVHASESTPQVNGISVKKPTAFSSVNINKHGYPDNAAPGSQNIAHTSKMNKSRVTQGELVKNNRALASNLHISVSGPKPVSSQVYSKPMKDRVHPKKANNTLQPGNTAFIQNTDASRMNKNNSTASVSDLTKNDKTQAPKTKQITNTSAPVVKSAEVNAQAENNKVSSYDSSTSGNKTVTSLNSPKGATTDSITVTKPTEAPSNIQNQTTAAQAQPSDLWSRVSIYGFFSPEYSNRRIVSNGNSESDSSYNFNNEETPGFSYTTGVKLQYAFSKHWSVQTGCAYSVFSQLIKPTTLNYDNGGFYLSSSSGTVELPASLYSAAHAGDSLNLSSNTKQIIQFINIPLLVKYSISVHKFTLYTYLGASVNFIKGEKTTIHIQNGGDIQSATVPNSMQGLKRNNYSLHLGLGLQYNISEKLSIGLEPAFDGSFTPINQGMPVNSFPYSIGLSTNIGYIF